MIAIFGPNINDLLPSFLIEESFPPLAASSAYLVCLHPFVVIFVIRGTVASAYMAIAGGSRCAVPSCHQIIEQIPNFNMSNC